MLRPIPQRNFIVMRLSVLLFVAVLAFPWGSTAIAQNCQTQSSSSSQTRTDLTDVPPEMISVLRSLWAQKQIYCQWPGPGSLVEKVPPVDARVDLTGGPIPPNVSGRHVGEEVLATVTGDGANIDEIAAENNLTVLSRRDSALLDAVFVRFGITDGRSVPEVLAALEADGRVQSAAPQHIYNLQSDEIEEARFAFTKIALNSDDVGVSGQNIKIAVIDTAVDDKHPSLKGAVAKQFDAIADEPVVTMRHGTAVAGLIAGRKMIRGVAPKAQLFIARAFDTGKEKGATAIASAIIDSLDWAKDQNVHVISMSFSGPQNALLSQAVAAASANGILLIAAAGNNGRDAPASYPAAEPWVLAVTATDSRDHIYQKANHGNYVFLSAPGVDILAPAPDQGIDMVRGTSFAAAIVTGVAALMLENSPDLKPQDIAERLEESAHDLGDPGRDPTYGYGLVNVAKTLGQ